MSKSDDLISRKAAIDALWKALFKYEDDTEKQFQESDELDVSEWIVHRIFVQNMSDIDRRTIRNLPSAQTEIIRCKDCIYFDKYSDGIEKYQWDGFCAFWARKTYENWYCSGAERRTDGTNDE